MSVNDLTNDILTALVGATPERKASALMVLRGETMQETEPYLTRRECARQVGVTACSLWRWQVPGHVIGGRQRFRISEVESYLASEGFRKRLAELKVLDRERRERRLRGKAEG